MKSGIIAITGISTKPNQKTAVENSIKYIPVITFPTGIVGQKLLKKNININRKIYGTGK